MIFRYSSAQILVENTWLILLAECSPQISLILLEILLVEFTQAWYRLHVTRHMMPALNSLSGRDGGTPMWRARGCSSSIACVAGGIIRVEAKVWRWSHKEERRSLEKFKRLLPFFSRLAHSSWLLPHQNYAFMRIIPPAQYAGYVDSFRV